MKELTEALNSQSFHFYLHASFIPRRRAASQQMTSIFSVLVNLAVGVVVLRTSSKTNATDRIQIMVGSGLSSQVKASKRKNKKSVNTH